MKKARKKINLHDDFFCDGPYYVLTSSSLGGSGITPLQLANDLSNSTEKSVTKLLESGICLPLEFMDDCALDGETYFVIGEMNKRESDNWLARLTGKLNIPCGKLVLLCGGGDEEGIEHAISGRPPDDDYVIFQVIDIEPGNYQVDLYAYRSSMAVEVYMEENPEIADWYESFHGPDETSYIINLNPLQTEIELPLLNPESFWCGTFEFRRRL